MPEIVSGAGSETPHSGPAPAPFGAALEATCDNDECSWHRRARFDTARALELAGYEHMRTHEMHAVTLNFEPPKLRTIYDVMLRG